MPNRPKNNLAKILISLSLLSIIAYFLFKNTSYLRVDYLKHVLYLIGQKHPVYFIFTSGCLISFGFPSSLLYLTSGLLYGKLEGIAIALMACSLHLALTHTITFFFLNKKKLTSVIHKICTQAGLQPNQNSLKKKDTLLLLLAIRCAPIPLFLQSYLLCLSKIKFIPYFLASVFFQSIWITLFCLAGDNFHASNSITWITLGLFSITLAIAFKFCYHTFKVKLKKLNSNE